MFTLSSAHAIGFAHSKMAGGWKSALIASGAYFFVLAGFILLTAYASAFDHGRGMAPDFLPIWAAWLLGFQCLVLIVFGSFRVSNCVRRDISTHMIESHRLMPVAAGHAVAGYLFHANFQLLAVAGANALLGLIVAGAGGVPVGDYLLAHMILFCFAAFIWSLICLLSFLMRSVSFAPAVGLLLGFVLSLMFFFLLPGVVILCSPLTGETIFSVFRGSFTVRWNYPVAIGAQMAFFVLFFLAACRRYRGTFPSTFHPLGALLVLLTWSVVSAVGITGWPDLHMGRMGLGADGESQGWQVLCSLASAMVLAALPVGALITNRTRGTRGTVYGIVFLLLTALGIWVVAIADLVMLNRTRALNTVLLGPLAAHTLSILSTVFAHALTLFLLMYVVRRFSTAIAWLIAAGAMAFIWFAPLVLEGILAAFDANRGVEHHFSAIATLSPLGLLANALVVGGSTNVTPLFGILTQWLIVLVLAVLALPRRQKTITPPPILAEVEVPLSR